MSKLTSYNEEDVVRFTAAIIRTQWADLHATTRKMSSDPQRRSLRYDEQTYMLQRGRCRQYSVDHSDTITRLTSYTTKTLSAPQRQSLVQNEQTNTLSWRRHHQIDGVNHSYAMNRLTHYDEKAIVRFTAAIVRTQWADLHTTTRKTSSAPQRQSLVRNEQTYPLQWERCHSRNHIQYSASIHQIETDRLYKTYKVDSMSMIRSTHHEMWKPFDHLRDHVISCALRDVTCKKWKHKVPFNRFDDLWDGNTVYP
jgi:hypothetical protein